jgi:hypothetical protein
VGLLAKQMKLESNSCDIFLARVVTSTGNVSRVHVTLSLSAEVMSFVLSVCRPVQLLGFRDKRLDCHLSVTSIPRLSKCRGFQCSLQNASVLSSESFEM